ncbi:unnamed protein product [Arctia plantaginis]|uniref:NADP-dependent oxidoreductase domain-containing protein n=1 Tax=Arctia plantaginis TaxID=874455 RepID=A0A8S0ZV26_ARCPL|nr:unnamed protein product [Arctia plantaginis]
MDWNRPGKLLRPNPDWEEDLFLTCVVGPVERARLKAYVEDVKQKKPRKPCYCQDGSPGVAPLMTLNNGRTIPSLGLGTFIGYDYQGVPLPITTYDTRRAVETAIDAGYRLFDTAYKYKNEDQVGQAIKNKIAEGVIRRSDVFVITKLSNNCHGEDAVIPALRRSLQLLELDYVDLYLIHWPVGLRKDGSYDETDYLDTWKGMIEARARGLTKSIGVSNFNQHQIDRIISLSKMKPAAVQIEVNLNIQQHSLIAFCHSHDIAVIAYTPFGSLFHRRAAYGAPPPRTDTPVLRRIADKHHKTVPQIVLRYLVELGVIPIPKSVTPKNIEMNIEVFDFKLTREEKDVLRDFERNYRTRNIKFWKDSPHYPFEK